MGASQSTNRAAKFSGSRRRVRSCNSAPPTGPAVRRSQSQRNTNRNVKEFSKFWSDGEKTSKMLYNSLKTLFPVAHRADRYRSRDSDFELLASEYKFNNIRFYNLLKRNEFSVVEPPLQKIITPLPTPYVTPRSSRNSQQLHESHDPSSRSLSQHSAYSASSTRYDHFDTNELDSPRVQKSHPDRLHALRFPHETAIY
ncbi:unnamed protein product [Haemonchus placei]|uniref:Uncharacterized protein n=1 Tax=Haemonchus placei TaxID=6290 RepID=A0A0N4WW49_HAEPC|nr:unnamed protein product [Haemonchus placei]